MLKKIKGAIKRVIEKKKEASLHKKSHVDYLIRHHLDVLKGLQYSSGLFGASTKSVKTGYDKCWLRDNFYECLAFDEMHQEDIVKKTYDALFKIFLKHEFKIDCAIAKKPQAKHEYIHARYHPSTYEEFWEDWGNKQNDAIGAILFMIGKLEKEGVKIVDNDDKKRIVQKLVNYLRSIQYWHDEDSGMWEENEEVHASSVGACLAGLISVKHIVDVPEDLIHKGRDALDRMLPRESKKKFVDLALLSLIYPYDIVSKKEAKEILANVEYYLVKNKGVIRYKNDYYYNANPDGFSQEAEWTMGFSWLAIIYKRLGDDRKCMEYMKKSVDTIYEGEIPELYYSNSDKPNDNTPLGWAESLFIVALHRMTKKHIGIRN